MYTVSVVILFPYKLSDEETTSSVEENILCCNVVILSFDGSFDGSAGLRDDTLL